MFPAWVFNEYSECKIALTSVILSWGGEEPPARTQTMKKLKKNSKCDLDDECIQEINTTLTAKATA